VQAKEVTEKVNAISKMLKIPVPSPLFWFSLLVSPEGSCSSKAPNKLKAKTMKIVATNRFTQPLAANSRMPVAPNRTATKKPIPVKVSMMPRA